MSSPGKQVSILRLQIFGKNMALELEQLALCEPFGHGVNQDQLSPQPAPILMIMLPAQANDGSIMSSMAVTSGRGAHSIKVVYFYLYQR